MLELLIQTFPKFAFRKIIFRFSFRAHRLVVAFFEQTYTTCYARVCVLLYLTTLVVVQVVGQRCPLNI